MHSAVDFKGRVVCHVNFYSFAVFVSILVSHVTCFSRITYLFRECCGGVVRRYLQISRIMSCSHGQF